MPQNIQVVNGRKTKLRKKAELDSGGRTRPINKATNRMKKRAAFGSDRWEEFSMENANKINRGGADNSISAQQFALASRRLARQTGTLRYFSIETVSRSTQ